MAATQPATEPAYSVRLESFEGPLDLLLRLIEKAELDITTISLARVTDQYLEHIHSLQDIHPDLLADFLVVAAKLILIKSRALLPRPPVVNEDEEDVGLDLVRQLEEYRRFKEAARSLQQREEEGMRSHVRTTPVVLQPHNLTPGEVSLGDLLAALQRVLATTPTVPINTVVSPVIISIDDKIRAIAAAITGGRRVHFSGLLLRARSRVEIVVTFLAVLEMMKQGQVVAEQDEAFGEIYIVARPRQTDQTSAAGPSEMGEGSSPGA